VAAYHAEKRHTVDAVPYLLGARIGEKRKEGTKEEHGGWTSTRTEKRGASIASSIVGPRKSFLMCRPTPLRKKEKRVVAQWKKGTGITMWLHAKGTCLQLTSLRGGKGAGAGEGARKKGRWNDFFRRPEAQFP